MKNPRATRRIVGMRFSFSIDSGMKCKKAPPNRAPVVKETRKIRILLRFFLKMK